MSQFSFESGLDEELQPRQAPYPELEPVAETTVEPAIEDAAAPEALSISVDEFSALEERVLRAVSLVKGERQARAAAEAKAAEADQRAAQAEVQLREQGPLVEEQQKQIRALHTERDQVRVRVERLLSQLDALEL
jgi:hypothetical protein